MPKNFVVDQAKWGDRVQAAQSATPELLKPDEAGERPIAIRVTDQEIGQLFASHTSPHRYSQFLLEKLRDAGAPVSGVLNLRLTRGKLARVKPDLTRPGVFHYLWLPDTHAKSVAELQKQMEG